MIKARMFALTAVAVFGAALATGCSAAAPAADPTPITVTVTTPTTVRVTSTVTTSVPVPTTVTIPTTQTVSATVTETVLATITEPASAAADAADASTPAATSVAPPHAAAQPPASGYYANCTAARAAGVTPLYRGEPGYSGNLDRDDDGIACE